MVEANYVEAVFGNVTFEPTFNSKGDTVTIKPNEKSFWGSLPEDIDVKQAKATIKYMKDYAYAAIIKAGDELADVFNNDTTVAKGKVHIDYVGGKITCIATRTRNEAGSVTTEFNVEADPKLVNGKGALEAALENFE